MVTVTQKITTLSYITAKENQHGTPRQPPVTDTAIQALASVAQAPKSTCENLHEK
jgi:hypothetical protein